MGHTVGILILGIATNDFSAVLAFGTFFTRVSPPRRRTTTTKLLLRPLSVARGQKERVNFLEYRKIEPDCSQSK